MALTTTAFYFLHVLSIGAFLSWDEKLLELAAFPSAGAKLPILASMIVSSVGPFAVDRLCVRLFDPELHKARKAGPPLTSVVRNNFLTLRLSRLFRFFVRWWRLAYLCPPKGKNSVFFFFLCAFPCGCVHVVIVVRVWFSWCSKILVTIRPVMANRTYYVVVGAGTSLQAETWPVLGSCDSAKHCCACRSPFFELAMHTRRP